MLLITRRPGEAFTLKIGENPLLAQIRNILDNIDGDHDSRVLDRIIKVMDAKSTDIAVRVLLLDIRDGRANIGIEAPRAVKVLREELER